MLLRLCLTHRFVSLSSAQCHRTPACYLAHPANKDNYAASSELAVSLCPNLPNQQVQTIPHPHAISMPGLTNSIAGIISWCLPCFLRTAAITSVSSHSSQKPANRRHVDRSIDPRSYDE
jgi:hypothetical protein